MTDHRTARRARKSKVFFARLAERALLEGKSQEANRLMAWTLRKRAAQNIAQTLSSFDARAF